MNSGDLKAFAALRLELTEERARLAARIKEIDEALGGVPAPTVSAAVVASDDALTRRERQVVQLVRANSGKPFHWYVERLIGPTLYKNRASVDNALWRLGKQGLVRSEGMRGQRKIFAVQ